MFTDQCQAQLMGKCFSIRHDIESESFENIWYDTIDKVKWRNIINHSSKIEKQIQQSVCFSIFEEVENLFITTHYLCYWSCTLAHCGEDCLSAKFYSNGIASSHGAWKLAIWHWSLSVIWLKMFDFFQSASPSIGVAGLHKSSEPASNVSNVKSARDVANVKSARDVASQMTALLNQDFEFGKSSEPSCVICVGSTGTGKSSTIGKVTRRAVSAGNGKDRVTFRYFSLSVFL